MEWVCVIMVWTKYNSEGRIAYQNKILTNSLTKMYMMKYHRFMQIFVHLSFGWVKICCGRIEISSLDGWWTGKNIRSYKRSSKIMLWKWVSMCVCSWSEVIITYFDWLVCICVCELTCTCVQKFAVTVNNFSQHKALWSSHVYDDTHISIRKDLCLWWRTHVYDIGPIFMTKDPHLWWRTHVYDEWPMFMMKNPCTWWRTHINEVPMGAYDEQLVSTTKHISIGCRHTVFIFRIGSMTKT